jgi:type II secretory pathway pseudopilin PulG
MLVVVAVIAILAAILIPSIGAAQKSAKKRKAELECNAIKTAVEQFFSDFHYMPWGDPADNKARVGSDQWAESTDDLKNVMDLLRGANMLSKSYLEFSSRDSKASASGDDEGVFYDPWKNPYRIGMDRNLDQQVDFDGKSYKARVLVYSLGPDGEDRTGDDIRTFDLQD